MIRRPPRSTLFPYTTLFRSPLLAEGPVADRRAGLEQRLELPGAGPAVIVGEVAGEGAHQRAAAALGAQRGVHLDRKSTRLNSSHANISYAVFCLKKKKKNHR